METLILINPNKNGVQQKTEGCTNRLCKLVKEKQPSIPVYPREAEGIFSVDFQELVLLAVIKDKVSVSWNIKKCKEKHIDYKSIGASFLEEENIQWPTSS